tara:strand:- start:207 stop:476 length:270 start_codon:yes stop_codon:yes gene_type:complete
MFRQELGAVIREQRLDLGLTLREISLRSSVALSYLSDIENGKKEPSSEIITAIVTALEMTLSDLLYVVADRLAIDEQFALIFHGSSHRS